MSVLEYTGIGLLLLAFVSVVVLMPLVTKGVRYWMWAWVAQIFSAPMQSAVLDNVYLASFAHGLSVMFPVLLLAGAYYFVGRVPPRWVIIAGSSVAILRGLFAIAGFYTLGRFVALPFELFAYAYSGWVIVKAIIWVVLGGFNVVVYRLGSRGQALWYMLILLGVLAAYMAVMKPV